MAVAVTAARTEELGCRNGENFARVGRQGALVRHNVVLRHPGVAMAIPGVGNDGPPKAQVGTSLFGVKLP